MGMKLSDRVYRLNLGVPKEFEDMSAYSAYLGNGVVSLEKERDELKEQLVIVNKSCDIAEKERDELRADITDLKDRLENGIVFSDDLNVYILVWTAREIEQARIEADKIYAKLVEPEALAEGK